ncbi:hypothetical protein B0J14DRAFT_329010 [Halenospora varia]|nr:hypothetical protein B0J14DRAFT_329010 [Halenospora varia]
MASAILLLFLLLFISFFAHASCPTRSISLRSPRPCTYSVDPGVRRLRYFQNDFTKISIGCISVVECISSGIFVVNARKESHEVFRAE